MTLNDRFRHFLKTTACPESRKWAKNRSIVQAWRDCPNGNWMAYWLVAGLQRSAIPSCELRQLLNGRDPQFSHRIFTDPHPPAELLRRANLLRATYTPSGRRRK